MWRRLLAGALSLPGLALLIAALGSASSRPVAILSLLSMPAAVAFGRWRARRNRRELNTSDYLSLGAVGPAAALFIVVALQNELALKALQVALVGGVFGLLTSMSVLALQYVRTERLIGSPRGTHDVPPGPKAATDEGSRASARGRVVDEATEGVTGHTEHQCPHCGDWTLVADPRCRACGRWIIGSAVGTA